jgi:hypothetical protein
MSEESAAQTGSIDDEDLLILQLVQEALNDESPLGDKFGVFPDPAWIESVADHVAWRTGGMDGVEEIRMDEARRKIDNLAFRGKLDRYTDDMWMDDKVSLPPGADYGEVGQDA